MKLKYLAVLILLIGLFWRLYHIDFGLPQSFYADEPEISEPAIKYTYDMKSIIKNKDYFELIPISYVYGTLPVYFMTASLMVFSRSLNILHIGFDKTTIFIFIRVLTALISLGVVCVVGLIAKKHFANNTVFIGTLLLTALNWKLIVHAHYANADIILVLLLLISFYFTWKYDQVPNNQNLFLAALFFGFAVGTKVTALISLPIYFYLILKKKDIYGVPGFIFSALISFIVTNPFSIIFFNDFSFRVFSMLTKEGGMVFDSVDTSLFKYVYGLNAMVTFPILALFIFGMIYKLHISPKKDFDIFLLANLVLYFVFFSIQSRRVDRWLLPILPIIFMYAAYAFWLLTTRLKRFYQKTLLFSIVLAIYMINPVLLLTQFQRWTPKSAAYLWAKTNLPITATKLSYTEEGLDPMNKLPLATVIQYPVYVAEEAQLAYPLDPLNYTYVILSSRPMENFKRPAVVNAYPNYANAWSNFEKTVQNPKYFALVKDFALTKPNLIPLSDVFIYKQVSGANLR